MTCLYLLIGGLMLGLGYWQMQRAAEKIELQEAADAAAAQKPVTLLDQTTTAGLPDSLPDYVRVEVSGIAEPARQLLWDNRIRNGVAGYEVIVPIRLKSTSLGVTDLNGTRQSSSGVSGAGSIGEAPLVLVNRGWVPVGTSRQQLPDVSFDADTPLRLIGTLTRPSTGFSSGPAVDPAAPWPRLLQHFEYTEIEQSFGEPVLPIVVELHEEETRLALGDLGMPLFPSNWQPVASGPERHYGYAFQWWAMFVALTGLFVILNIRKLQTPAS